MADLSGIGPQMESNAEAVDNARAAQFLNSVFIYLILKSQELSPRNNLKTKQQNHFRTR